MYGLDRNVDLAFLLGRELIQIAIGMDQVIFNFDTDVSISVEGQFEYTNKSKTISIEWSPGSALAAASTANLLTARVETIEEEQDGTLKLTFSNGDRLVVHDVSTEFESYQISRPGETIVV